MGKLFEIKKILFVFWIMMIGITVYNIVTIEIPLNEYPEYIASSMKQFGIWAPLFFILLFAIRPLIFFPATILSLSAGVLFGTTQAIVILIIAENLSSFVSYTLGKYFGRSIIDALDKKNVFIHKFESYLHENGFIAVLTMRLLYAPFDLVGYFSGSSNIPYKDFATATFVGILPGIFMSAFLGGSLHNPMNIFISVVFFILGIVLSRFIKQKNKYVT